MNPVSLDIKDLLIDNGLANFNSNLFVSKEPSEPINCLTIYDTGGGDQNPKLAIDLCSIQIRSRNVSYVDGYKLLFRIRKFIEGKSSVIVNNTHYFGFFSQNVLSLNRDNKNYAIWVLNIKVYRAPNHLNRGNRY